MYPVTKKCLVVQSFYIEPFLHLIAYDVRFELHSFLNGPRCNWDISGP